MEKIQKQHRQEEPKDREPIVKGHRPEETTFITLQLELARRAGSIEFKPRALLEQRRFSAIGATMTKPPGDDLCSSDSHVASSKKTLSRGGKRLSNRRMTLSGKPAQEPT